MPPRMMGAAQARPFLSWGEASDMPRSSVWASNDMLFVGSLVRPRSPRKGQATGKVAELVDREHVRVQWAGGTLDTVTSAGLTSVARPAGMAPARLLPGDLHR